jgi:very-short-patch-repair endonuclease
MNDKGVPSLVGLSRSLRKRMTKEERHIWYDFLKGLPQTVKRQEPFGRYIADFYCADARLAIEIDGSRHYSEEGRSKDEERDAFFAGLGIMVLRYTNYEVNTNFEGVCLDIKKHLDGRCWREHH